MPLQIIRQDITKIECDAIVNPTNEYLLPGGSTDAAIHEVAGKELFEACGKIGYLEVGGVAITSGFNLPAKYVIHTVGPWWDGGNCGERELLESCYKKSLLLAKENGCESIAFPLISSGTYEYPKDKVLKIAIDTISEFLFENEMMVYLVVFDKMAYEISEKLFSGIKAYIDDMYFLEHSDNFEEIDYARSKMDAKCLAPMMAQNVCAPLSKSLKTESIEDYIKLDESFAVKLFKLIDAKKMTDVECYKKANVSKQTWYKIMNEKGYKPNKKTVISFAVALGLSLDETQDLLKSVGFVLSNSSMFDVIIMYCIDNGIYDVLEIDSVLFKYDQETLYSKM